MLRKLLCSIVLILISGCYGVPRPEQIAATDFGSPPTDYEEKIKAQMSRVLFDPYSAVYQCNQPCRAATVTPLWLGEHHYGWRVICGINAKNRMGGYVGTKEYSFFFNPNGVLEEHTGTARCV